jgi:hypothetical protein
MVCHHAQSVVDMLALAQLCSERWMSIAVIMRLKSCSAHGGGAQRGWLFAQSARANICAWKQPQLGMAFHQRLERKGKFKAVRSTLLPAVSLGSQPPPPPCLSRQSVAHDPVKTVFVGEKVRIDMRKRYSNKASKKVLPFFKNLVFSGPCEIYCLNAPNEVLKVCFVFRDRDKVIQHC